MADKVGKKTVKAAAVKAAEKKTGNDRAELKVEGTKARKAAAPKAAPKQAAAKTKK